MSKFIVLAACILLGHATAFSQAHTQAANNRLYFEFTALDFDKYAELVETVKSDGNFTIETACIPAKVICVKTIVHTATANGFKQLASLTGLTAAEWPQGKEPNAFDQRCLNARSGN